jgi:hypothetical protein
MQTQLQDMPLETLEAWRDQLAARVSGLTRETDRHCVEGFYYEDLKKARRVRGRLACSALRRIDAINGVICQRIYPTFATTPGEGFSDRVQQRIARVVS